MKRMDKEDPGWRERLHKGLYPTGKSRWKRCPVCEEYYEGEKEADDTECEECIKKKGGD